MTKFGIEKFKLIQGIFCSVFLLKVLASSVEASGNEVLCESIVDFSWGYAGKYKTCDLDGTTNIDSLGFTIVATKDESIAAIQFARNKKIFYLLEKVNDKFPNLILYSANECSIREVSKVNFRGLKNLKSLYLYHNQIEKIQSDTFEDLTSLKELELHNNQIKFINGEAFHSLIKLERVTLSFNLCINEDFEDPTRISSLPQMVKNSCGFCEKIVDITNCEMLKEIKEIQMEKLETFVKEVLKGQKDEAQASLVNQITEKNLELQLENAAMKSELEKQNYQECSKQNATEKDLKLEIQTCEIVQNELKTLNEKLENQAKILQDFMTKDKETFLINLEEKTSEFSNKTATIAKLEAELKAAKDQSVMTEDFQRKLEAQQNEMFNAKIKELSSEVEKLKAQIEFCSKQPLC